MSHRERTPALLEPYLQIPSKLSSVLVTGTLSCNSSWLTARILSLALQSDAAHGIVVVSWINDRAFWSTQLKRTTSVDIDRPELKSRLSFVDRLDDSLSIPARSASAELTDIESQISEAVRQCSADKILLLLDGIDTLLAIQPEISALQLSNLLMKLRTLPKIHSSILTSTAELSRHDERRLAPSELNNAAFITQQAHVASSIISVRELDTGSARDVSGIIRITNGGQGSILKELEKRYLVQRDGLVKIVE